MLQGGPETAAVAAPASDDAFHALRNALKLGVSLVASWGVALGARVILPRYLGPESFGVLNFADAFSAAVFSVLTLGADVYIRKEVTVRPELSSQFFGSLVTARAMLAVLLIGALFVVLPWTGRPLQTQLLVGAFCAWQLLFINNASLAALLHAKEKVDGLSIANVACKLLWGAGLGVAVLLDGGLFAVALAFLVSEAFKTAWLWALARRILDLRFHLDVGALKTLVRASLPYYVNGIALAVSGRLSVTVLTFTLKDQREAGWYGAAGNVSGIVMMLTPLLAWVMLPLLAKAASRSMDEFHATLARSLELVLVIALPLGLGIGVGADLIVPLLFGHDYAPAILALRLLAPTLVITYMNTISSQALVVTNRGWNVTLLSFIGLVVSAVLTLVLVSAFQSTGEGGGGAGAALAVLLNEVVTFAALFAFIGRKILDREKLWRVARNLTACVLAVAVYVLLVRLGHWRILFAALSYLGAAFGLRAIPLDDFTTFARHALNRRKNAPARA